MRISDLVTRHARARPNASALSCRTESFTWRELDERTDALGAVLARSGRPGDRVAIVTANCHRHWETVFAASKAALVSVPLNHRWTAEELASTIAEVAAAAVVVDLGLPHSTGAELVDRLGPVPVLGFGPSHDGADDFDRAIETGRGLPPVSRDPWPHNAIGFTSGTTGRPRGAVLSQDHAITSAMWIAALHGFRADDSFLGCMPIYVYRGGSGGLAPMIVGARTVLCDFDPDAVLEIIERQRITHVILAPVMVDRLLASPRAGTVDLGSLREVWVGGAPSSPESIAALQDLVGDIVGSMYGGTEATAVASMRWPSGPDQRRLLRSIGRPAPLNDVRLVTESGDEAAPGEAGEIQVRGKTVMSGYWPDTDGDGLADGWYATGDIAVRDDDGYLFLVDRRADIINTGGLNVYSVEVEQVLVTHPDVAECAVVSSPDDSMGEAVTAVVVPTTEPIDPDVLREHCRTSLAGYKCPRVWLFRDELARNAMGKVDKRRIRDELWVGWESSLGGSGVIGGGTDGAGDAHE